jgi:uncharacterized membrane protein YqjE
MFDSRGPVQRVDFLPAGIKSMDLLESPKRKMALPSDATNGSISGLVVKLADGLGKLVTEHLELAKVELVDDTKELGRLVARLAVVVPFLLVGYSLLCAGIALVLSTWIPLSAALLILAVLNLLGGGLGLYAVVRKVQKKNVMDETLTELNLSVQTLMPSQASMTLEVPRERAQ